MKHDDDATDILSEARRRPLSREEDARLEELVERSPEARILHYAGWAFDRDSSAREDDDVLVAKLAARAADRVAKPVVTLPGRRRRRPLFTLVAAALALAGTAGAGAGVVYLARAPERAPEVANLAPNAANVGNRPKAPGRAPSAPRAPVSTTESVPAPVPPAPVGPVVAPLDVPIAPSPVTASAPARITIATPAGAPSPVTASQPKRTRTAPDLLSAKALFGEANKKRLAGDTAGAIALYKLLAERHPGSAEAALAELSLGKLMLATGDATGALLHFKLAQASGGALGSEALWGEAQAQKALGRASDERAALRRLLSEYPDGAYAKAARKRLGTDAP
jgi:TolA-binding protein